ncbi:APO protein 3, mitochondrial-like [Zingiber officinale]|nr:APO protein 3, mitochondrial-like [Zingiber officinale]
MLLRKIFMRHSSCTRTQIRTPRFSFSAHFASQRSVRNNEEIEDKRDVDSGEDFAYSEVLRPGPKWQRKPYPTPMKVLIRRAKEEKLARKLNPCRILESAPENGLLVPDLIEVAHQVYNARESMLHGLSILVEGEAAIPINKCRFCSEVHIGHVGHVIRSCEGRNSGMRNSKHLWRRGGIKDIIGLPYCYHLYDRVGKPRVGHKERFGIKRLPAIVELCIQAGLDLEAYPTKRRTKPVYSIEGRIVDFEPGEDTDILVEDNFRTGNHIVPTFLEDRRLEDGETVSELSARTLKSWLDMRSGAVKLMKKYSVITCGYCPEVQVGPKGHKVRLCKATKHQSRDGLHAWQEATIDDLIRPNYVWHVRALDGPPLINELKRYYGKAPALVELCVRAGAPIPKQYESMMRLDVVPPAPDEYDLVV